MSELELCRIELSQPQGVAGARSGSLASRRSPLAGGATFGLGFDPFRKYRHAKSVRKAYYARTIANDRSLCPREATKDLSILILSKGMPRDRTRKNIPFRSHPARSGRRGS